MFWKVWSHDLPASKKTFQQIKMSAVHFPQILWDKLRQKFKYYYTWEEGLNRFLEIAQRFQLDGIGISDETVASNHNADESTPKSPVKEKFENEMR